MRKVQLALTLATVGATAAVAGPAMAETNVSTQVATSTAPQLMPILFGGTASIYGQRVDQGDPIPKGSTVVTITIQPLAGQTGDALFTASCPEGSGAADFGQPSGGASLGGGFDAPLAQQTMQFRFVPPFTGAAGFSDVFMLCLPTVSNQVTTLKTKIVPVTIPTGNPREKLTKGAHLPAGQLLVRNRLVGLQQGEAAQALTSCPKRYLPSYAASATKGVKVMAGGDVLGILPPAKGVTRATVYTVCASAAVR